MPTILVTKTFEFEASHYLPGYDGACGNIHGHSYKLEVEIEEDLDHFLKYNERNLPSDSMVVDFSILKKAVKTLIIDFLDHQHLNQVTIARFPCEMPTAENMVVWIFETLRDKEVFNVGIKLSKVRLWETSTSYAEIRT